MPLNLRFRRTASPHCREEEDSKMGCSASKPMMRHAALNDWYPPLSKGISMPTHAQNHMQVDDFQIVPLAGSRYGIMKVEAPSGAPEDSKDHLHGDFIREALKRLENLDLEPDSGPQSRLEPMSVLEDLKPGLEKYFIGVGGLKEVIKSDTGEKSTARVSSGRGDSYAASEALSNEAGAYPEEERVVNKGTSLLQQGRDQHGRVDCKAYISSISSPSDRKKNSRSFRGMKSLSKLFSFGAQAKKESRSARIGKTSGSAAFQNDFSEDSGNNLSEPRSSLFDADFLASFEDVVKKFTQDDWESLQSSDVRTDSFPCTDAYKVQALEAEAKGRDSRNSAEAKGRDSRNSEAQVLKPSSVGNSPVASKRTSALKQTVAKKADPLERFSKVFLPGGEKAVVLYTTSLRGVRKTFEDCSSVRAVLESFRISIDERDISMHQDFRNELREMMGKPVPVPQLFIKGRYIGGVEEVLELHEEGQLVELMEGMPVDKSNGRVCEGCGGVRFVPCLECSGSCKLVNEEQQLVRCPHCNENGLMQCPLCCY